MNTATYLALERRVGVYWTSDTATFRSRRLKLEKLNVSGAAQALPPLFLPQGVLLHAVVQMCYDINVGDRRE